MALRQAGQLATFLVAQFRADLWNWHGKMLAA
jgi:hypothetical protein